MEIVALALQKQAIELIDDRNSFDLFGRSAFNRYYYALYLPVRQMLSQCDPSWERMPHLQVPGLLRGAITTELKKRLKRFQRLSDPESIQTCNRALSALQTLAKTMEIAYATRVAADYSPSLKVCLTGDGRFSLNNISINQAHAWPSTARLLTTEILKAWNIDA